MFLKNLIAQNPAFARAVIDLHQAGALPPDTYVIDLDMVAQNARSITDEAHRLGLEVVAMTKQFGRNPVVLNTLRANGVDSFVAVDMTDARAISRTGHPLGNVGHLVQVPKHAAAEMAGMRPQNWTVFSEVKAAEAAAAHRWVAEEGEPDQSLLARVFGRDDIVVETHAGGFKADDVLAVADRFDELSSARFGGVTSYPALVFDRQLHKVVPSPNLLTLERVAERLRDSGREGAVINGPGETSTNVLSLLAEHGVTQVEPGHGFTATGAYHAFASLPEKPAMLYLSEVSHLDGGSAFCFGGGLYLCVGSVDYQPQAIVGRDFETASRQMVDATLSQNHQVIDFYGRLAQTPSGALTPGDTVVFCFRAQVFYVRSHVAPVSGIQSGAPKVEGIYTVEGRLA